MTDVPDFIEKMGVTLRSEHDHCRMVYKSHNAMFPGIEPSELRKRFNEAMSSTIVHYTGRLADCGVTLSARQIEDVSFAVVLHTLYVYNLWRSTYEEHRNHALRVDAFDLQSVQANDQCWFYCVREFGPNYVRYAAALTNMTVTQFMGYEEGRQAFFNR
jgi:hypothetical protein